MLLLFPKPEQVTAYHTLAVNLESYDEIFISKNNETNLFSLAIVRQFDAHGSNQSTFFYILGTFESVDDCIGLFQKIVDALNAGERTLELPPFDLPTQPETQGRQDRHLGYN